MDPQNEDHDHGRLSSKNQLRDARHIREQFGPSTKIARYNMAHECQLLNVLVREACRRIRHLQLHSQEVVRRFHFVRQTRRGLLVQRLLGPQENKRKASGRSFVVEMKDAILTAEQKPEGKSTSNPIRDLR